VGVTLVPVTLRKERRLRVLDNRMLRRIFGPVREKVRDKWRRLHFAELYDLHFSANIMSVIKNNVMGGACSTYWVEERCIQCFGWETRWRLLGRRKRR
jgi:hypothetical protein